MSSFHTVSQKDSGFSSHLSSPSRLPPSSQATLSSSTYTNHADLQKLQRTIIHSATITAQKENRIEGGQSIKNDFEATRKKTEAEKLRRERYEYAEALKKKRQHEEDLKKKETLYKLSLEKNFASRESSRISSQKNLEKQRRLEDLQARREAAILEKHLKEEADVKQRSYEAELRQEELNLKEQKRQKDIKERRERLIAKREEKRRLEISKNKETKTKHEEFESNWEKEVESRKILKKAKKVKDKVFHDLSRMNEEDGLLDIPFAA
ncbi:hypothetical protein TrVE_jg4007 [Triparma verrucosa]|uniref:Uncharacterized protein n=1 Tax=Triparma verrucosa TaxID=1606542 RepID=A0A9W7FE61_9STRA|nr:hypothetical protein TrVE_jg4007 [Triparma verrucosa]